MNDAAFLKLRPRGARETVDVRCMRERCLQTYTSQPIAGWIRYRTATARGASSGWSCGRCGGTVFEEISEVTT